MTMRWAMAVMACGLVAAPAAQAVDLTGLFRAEVSTPLAPGNVLPCSVDFVQSGGTLDASVTCSILPAVTLTGTINPLFGFFNLSGTIPFVCPTLTLTGLGAANSYTFSGFLNCSGGVLPLAGTMTGSRCGNGQLDAGETCEDGNWVPNDCCSATCQLAAAGTACTSDDNTCTTDACTAGGTCQHTNNTLACDDGSACTSGDACGGGSCHGAFVAAGTACSDGDPCTPSDACDGGGTCVPAGTLDCGACMTCAPGEGCTAVGQVATSCDGPVEPTARLQMKDAANPDADSALWKLANAGAATSADFGNPTAGTGYRLCVFAQSAGTGYDRAVLGVAVPAGSGWVATATGFKYRSKTGAARVVGLKAAAAGKTKLLVKAKGSALDLPPLPLDLTHPLLVQLQATNGSCWQAEYQTAATNTAVKFLSKTGSASGAFVDGTR